MKVSQYPRNADGTPMDLEVGVLTDATGNGGARLVNQPIGPDNAPIDAKALVLVDSDGGVVDLTGPDTRFRLTPDDPRFGATRYDPDNPVETSDALQAFYDFFKDEDNARRYVGDARGAWFINKPVYACYWDGHEPNVRRRFKAPSIKLPPIAQQPGGVAMRYALEVAGQRMDWEGTTDVSEHSLPTGTPSEYANTTYAERRCVYGVHVRSFANSTMGPVFGSSCKRGSLHFEGWQASFTANGVVFPNANSIGARVGGVYGRFCGSSELYAASSAPAQIVVSARENGKNTGAAFSAEVYSAVFSAGDDQRTKITCGGGTTTADIEVDDVGWCRVELAPAIYGTVAADNATSKVTWSAGDPTNLDGAGHGLQVGDIYPIFQAGPNTGKIFRILDFSGTSNRVIHLGIANPEDTNTTLTSHAASADPTYQQFGKRYPFWVAQVIDATHFTVTPCIPARMNSTIHMLPGAVLKAEGDDLSTVCFGTISGLLCSAGLITKGNFAPSYDAILAESCGAAMRIGDPSYAGGLGLNIGAVHAEGCLFDMINGTSTATGTINLQSFFDFANAVAYTPVLTVNDPELTPSRQLGAIDFLYLGTLIENATGGTYENRSGTTLVTNSPRLRKLYSHEANPVFTIGTPFDIARLNTKNHWAEIHWTGVSGEAPGTMTLNMHPTLAGMGWTFAGDGSGTAYVISDPGQPIKLQLYYIFGQKKISILTTPHKNVRGNYITDAGGLTFGDGVTGMRVIFSNPVAYLQIGRVDGSPCHGRICGFGNTQLATLAFHAADINCLGNFQVNGTTVIDGATGSVVAAAIPNDIITFAKMQNVSSASKLLGRGDSGAGDPQEITLGSGLSMTGTTLSSSGGSGVTDGDKGDITVSGGGAAWAIDAGVVTLAKMANMATASLIYRKTAGAGAPEVNTLATLKADLALASGDISGLTYFATGTDAANLTGTVAAARIAANSLALTKLAAAGAASLVGATAAGDHADLTPAQAHDVLVPQVQTVASAATITPTFSNDQVNVTALAVATQLLNWTGTAISAYGLVVRIKDNGTARALTYDTKYRGTLLPTTTVANKTLYIGFVYNSTDDKFDCVAAQQVD